MPDEKQQDQGAPPNEEPVRGGNVRDAIKGSEKALKREQAGRLSTLEQRMAAIRRAPIRE